MFIMYLVGPLVPLRLVTALPVKGIVMNTGSENGPVPKLLKADTWTAYLCGSKNVNISAGKFTHIYVGSHLFDIELRMEGGIQTMT